MSEKSWREKLTDVGGYDNELLGIPAGGVREMVDEIERLSAEVKSLKAILKETVENPGGDYYTGLNCGVEDRDIYDRYEAAAYGWDSAFEYIQSISDGK